jgi:phosphatidate cytidylyltransferase
MFENKKRIMTGLSLVVGFIIMGITDYYAIVWLFLGAVFLLSFYEAMSLFKIDNPIVMVYAVAIWLSTLIFSHPELLSLFIFMIYVSLITYNKSRYQNEIKVFLYPTIPALFLLGLYEAYGISSLFWLVAVVASADSGAYFTGKGVGKTPFSPISPNKTIEGVIGGVLFGTIIGTIFGMWTAPSFYTSFIVSFISAVTAVFGDLYQSSIKREAGVKDSGNIFPGHGGMLDRVDGYLFSVIVMFSLLGMLS